MPEPEAPLSFEPENRAKELEAESRRLQAEAERYREIAHRGLAPSDI